jgi:DNA-directed RNA polymerase sigma subunit (sigma70/sigma32)
MKGCSMSEVDINKHIYNQIRSEHTELDPSEQDRISLELDLLFKDVSFLAWENFSTRRLLNLEWLRRRTLASDPAAYANVSKMGRDYNSAKAGHNKLVRKRINETFRAARLLESQGFIEQGALLFKEINLHPTFLITNDHLPMLEQHSRDALVKIDAISNLRDQLVKGVMKVAAELAYIRFKQTSGEVIDYSDLVQEALKSAYEGTLIYTSAAEARWSTFAFSRMKGVVGKYVAENSRTVSLPRSLLDKYVPIQMAIRKIGSSDFGDVALLASKINAERKEKSSGRKLDPSEIYTPEDVEWFLRHVNDWMSLDVAVNENADENREVTLGETLTRNVEEVEAAAEKSMTGRSLRKILSEILCEEEYTIFALKWGLDEEFSEPLEYPEVLTVFKQRYPGRKMHRIRIKTIERETLNKLKEAQILELEELWDAFNTIITRSE